MGGISTGAIYRELRELGILREQALTQLRQGSDAVSLALTFGGAGKGGVALRLLAARRDALQRELDGIAAERTHYVAHERLAPVDVAVFRRGEHLRAAEIAWIDETITALAPPRATAVRKRAQLL